MNRYYNADQFFEQLYKLLKNDIPVGQAIEILSRIRGTAKNVLGTQCIAEFVLQNLQKGFGFSHSLSLCPHTNIENNKVALLEAGEHSGCLKDVIEFICMQNKQKSRTHQDIKNAAVYPAIVVICAFAGTLLLMYWKNLFLTNLTAQDMVLIIARALFAFVGGVGVVSAYVFVTLKEPFTYALYYSLGFLQSAGFTFSYSLELIMHNAHTSIKESALLLAYTDISRGYSLSASLKEAKLADEKITALLELAEHCGTVAETCTSIAQEIATLHEQKKKHCLQLIEPLLLLITGVYLLILMDGIIMPYLTDFGGII